MPHKAERPAGGGARLDIDVTGIGRNWRRFGGDPRRIAAVVKANAYGLGVGMVAGALSKLGCRSFYVASAEEGAALRALVGHGAWIGVLNGPTPDDVGRFAVHELTPVLNSLPQARLWLDVGGGGAVWHFDTGMNRLGVPPEEWAAARAMLPEPHMLMSHLACAEMPSDPANGLQLRRFREAAGLFPAVRLGLAASAGAALGTDYAFDQVRIGLGLYGGGPDIGAAPPAQVARVTAPVLQIRHLRPGEGVGYGGTYRLRADAAPRTLACLGIGYADGLLCSGSDAGYAVLDGRLCPIRGRISMDLTMIDVTGLDSAAGARAELLGADVPLNDQARAFKVIPYELLTGIGARVHRS